MDSLIHPRMAFTSQESRLSVSLTNDAPKLTEEYSPLLSVRKQGLNLITAYGQILRWTRISLIGFWLIFPLFFLIGYWLRFIQITSHLEENSHRDDQINLLINQISLSGMGIILFTCIGVYNFWEFYVGIFIHQSTPTLLLFLINGLIFGPTLWGYTAWNIFPKIIVLLEDLNPYYYANTNLNQKENTHKNSYENKILLWFPIINLFILLSRYKLLSKSVQFLLQDWLN